MKKLFLLLLGLFFATSIYAYQADVEYISTDKYFDTAIHEIQNAKESVTVYMYLVSVSEFRKGTRPFKLIDSLVKTKNRGLDVEVVFDQNIDFQKGSLSQKQLKKSKNLEAYEVLKENGIKVFFDSPSIYTHAKVIIIDNQIVLLGSSNWTNTGLTRNIESNLLVKSKKVAQDVLEDLKRVPRQESRLYNSPSTPLSWEFLNNKNLLGAMVTDSSHRAFDTYLALLKEYDGNREGKVTADYEILKEGLNLSDIPRQDYRRQITKTLKQLQDKYNLIDLTLNYNQNAEVILKDYQNPKEIYQIPETKYLKIPHDYWTYNWNKTLPLAAKVFYLLSLAYSDISPNPPKWFASQEVLSQRHHVGKWFLSKGVTTLRRLNLLEVEYDTLQRNQNDQRKANIYLPNPLYNPKRLQSQLKNLEQEYGKEKLKKAQALVRLVLEDNDLNAIRTFIKLEDKYGLEVIQEAASIIEEKNIDNPRRSIAYFIRTIEKMGAREFEKEKIE